MNKSESIKNLAAALITFHMKVDKIKKDATNPYFKSKYASLSNILDSVQFPLSESGLSFVQFPTGEDGLTTILMHAESGEFIMGDYTMKPVKNDPQGKGSVITYQRRYALCAVLGLNIEEDDDANLATGNKVGKTEATTETAEKPWLNENSDQFKGAVEKMKAGQSSIEALKKYFRISKATETKLLEQSKKK